MTRLEHLTDVDAVRQVATLLEAENARLHRRIEQLVQENAQLKGVDGVSQLQLEMERLKEQLSALQQLHFGASSEKLPRPPGVKPPRKSQRGHGPRAQPELPVQEVLLPLDDADKVCGLCGEGLHAWEGQTEDAEEVTVVERSFVLRRLKRQKYRCGHGCAPVTAPAPPRLIPGGRYSVDFAVHVALMKYGFHLPLARQQKLYAREGLVVESQTLWDQLEALARHLEKSYEALLAEVFTSALIHADETHWHLLVPGTGTRWYVWTVASPHAVYHRMFPSRSGATAKTVLGDYEGVVLVDGYAAYQTATKSGADGPAPAQLAFCWAHVRRKFFEAQKTKPVCREVLLLIGELYAIEADLPLPHALAGEARTVALAHRLAVRQEKSAPVVERIREWALAQRSLPGSAFRKALEYMHKLWPGLTLFLSNPLVPLGRVEHWRGDHQEWGVAVSGRLSRAVRRCLIPLHDSVSSARSSNRTCGSPASGSHLRPYTPSPTAG